MPATRYVQAVPFYPTPSPSRYASSHTHYTVDALRKFAQGAGSALLVFSGADTVTSTPVAGANTPAAVNGEAAGFDWTMLDFSSVEGLLNSVVNGPFTGHFQIIAAALLFLAAGRCVARFAGLAAAAVVMFLYMQGVTLEDTWFFFERFAQRLVAAANAFQTADIG